MYTNDSFYSLSCLKRSKMYSFFSVGRRKKGQIGKHPNTKVLPTENNVRESMRTVNTLLIYPVD